MCDHTRTKRWTLTALALLAGTAGLFAQEYATVRNLYGSVQVSGAQDPKPIEVTLNTPLMEGDTLWTGRSGRLDVMLQDGNHLWMDYDSRLELDRLPSLDPNQKAPLQARLWKGSLLLDLQGSPSATGTEYLIATPSATVSVFDRGLILVEVESVDRTRVTALEGDCDLASAGGAVRLQRMQMSYAEYGYAPTPAREAGVLPAAGLLAYRDANLPRPVRGGESIKYLPENLHAYSAEFDTYGTWVYNSTYGHIWRPSPAYISAGWSPYYNGRWWYGGGWGATWIPYEPWGWCHHHYGRWHWVVGFGWGWIPGYVFSPAWVSWYWGDGWIGWCPWGWNGPSYGPHGWCSVTINNFYVNNVTTVVQTRTDPPRNPPVFQPPALKPPPGKEKVFGNPGPVDSIHLRPSDIQGYREGRVDLATLRSGLVRPLGSAAGSERGGSSTKPSYRPPLARPDQPWRSGDNPNATGSANPTPGAPRPTRADTVPGAAGTSGRATKPASSGAGPVTRTEGSGTTRVEPRPQYQPPERAPSDTTQRPSANPPQRPTSDPAPQPTYNPPQRPTYDPPQRPSADPPQRPSYDPPQQPSYNPPQRPTYDPPSQPSYDPPQRPTYDPPSQPSYDPPQRPSYDPPSQPSYEPPARDVPSRTEPPRNYSPPSDPPPAKTEAPKASTMHTMNRPRAHKGKG